MILLLLIAAGLFAVGVLPGRLTGVIVSSALLLGIIIIVNLAARRQFIVFNRDTSTVPQGITTRFMDPMDKLSLRATGLFEVEGRVRCFTDLQATYRSFQTREHSVVAIVPPSRALLVGRWPDEEIGMWYIFFKGAELRRCLLYTSVSGCRCQVVSDLLPATCDLCDGNYYVPTSSSVKRISRRSATTEANRSSAKRWRSAAGSKGRIRQACTVRSIDWRASSLGSKPSSVHMRVSEPVQG